MVCLYLCVEATVGNEASHAVVQEGGERSESAVEEKAVAAANGECR